MTSCSIRRLSRAIRSAYSMLFVVAALTEASAQVTIAPRALVRGRVTSTSDDPIAGAVVRIGPVRGAETDADGRFAVRIDSAGRYELRVLKIGFESWRDSIAVVLGQVTDRDVQLVPSPVRHAVMTDTGIPRSAEADTAPVNAAYTDAIVRPLGFEPLRQRRRSPDHRELRFWIPPNHTVTGWMIRVVERGRTVDVSLYLTWVQDTLTDSTIARYIAPAELRRVGCNEVRQHEVLLEEDTVVAGGCRVPIKRLDWRAFLRNMERHDVWTLPDESEITRSTTVIATGGDGAIVEALDGLRYHTYEYWNPHLYENPETRHAYAVIRALDAVFLARSMTMRNVR